MAMITKKVFFIQKTKDNVIIRTAHPDDAERIIEFKKQIFSETPNYMLMENDEFCKNVNFEREKKWLEQTLNSQNDLVLVVENADLVVGLLAFSASARNRLKHVGEFGMSVHKNYRRQGIAKELILTLLNWVKVHPVICKVSLSVFSINLPALKLYESLGFAEEGRKIKGIGLANGQYLDDILMYLWVDKK